MKNRLQHLRKLKQKSQAQLARDLGVSRQAVNGFESGKFDPSLEMAFKIAHCFDVAIEDIFIYEAKHPMQTVVKRVKRYFGSERFAQKAINVIKFAGNESEREQLMQVEPKHILAGLLADPMAMSARVLREHGVTFEVITDDHSFEFRGDPKLNKQCKKILDYALEAVQQRKKKSIGTEHLLWGFVKLAMADPELEALMHQYDIDLNSLNSQLHNML